MYDTIHISDVYEISYAYTCTHTYMHSCETILQIKQFITKKFHTYALVYNKHFDVISDE